jgi:hypothetical protein
MPFCRYLLIGQNLLQARRAGKIFKLSEKHFFCRFFPPKECIYFFFLLPGGRPTPRAKPLFVVATFSNSFRLNSLISWSSRAMREEPIVFKLYRSINLEAALIFSAFVRTP